MLSLNLGESLPGGLSSECRSQILDGFSAIVWPYLYGQTSVQFPCNEGDIVCCEGFERVFSLPVSLVEEHQVLSIENARVYVEPVSLQDTTVFQTFQSVAYRRSRYGDALAEGPVALTSIVVKRNQQTKILRVHTRRGGVFIEKP